MHRLAQMGRDPLLDEAVVMLAERALLRRDEICRLRLRDLHFDRLEISVWGKNNKHRIVPMTPVLAAFLRRYVEDRRPAHVPPEQWLASDERLLRLRPTATHPNGRAVGRRRVENMLDRFHRAAPELFADGDLCLHSFRHAGATYLDATYGALQS
jgi:integrase